MRGLGVFGSASDFLHLLPGIPDQHARRRLTLVSCDDASPAALTRKILERPRVLERIRQAIPDPAAAHMTCFTVTELERKLALRLNLPIYGCDPSLLYWGSKSGSRRIFRERRARFCRTQGDEARFAQGRRQDQ